LSYFDKAFGRSIMAFEGFYDNDPRDTGGETIWGIARKHNPDWAGWGVVDMARSKPDFPDSLKSNVDLLEAARTYYRRKYWNGLDAVEHEMLALECFDCAINQGVSFAVSNLQKSVNALNKNGDLFADITEDGFAGPATMAAANYLIHHGEADLLLKLYRGLRIARYAETMRSNPKQEIFARSWLRRV
jgi:lysozyme family protein